MHLIEESLTYTCSGALVKALLVQYRHAQTHTYLELVGLLYDHFYLCVFAQTGTAHLGHLFLLRPHQRLVFIRVT